jgi:beta-galactosidase
MSKAMLIACDRLGMLVMDELSDMWTRSKNINDYSQSFPDTWERDTELLVAKDFNHPSVILYSMGNEIQEAGTAKGAELNRKIDNKIKSLDSTRYTTNAINGLLAAMKVMPQIVMDITKMTPEQMAAMMQGGGQPGGEKNEGGSDALNGMMGMMIGPMADAVAAHPIMSAAIEEYAESMDVAGYNYMTGRHEIDHTLYPNRVVLGAETFPADIVRLWGIVKNNPHVIGDMTWTGYDYLGEAGIGIFYYDGTVNFSSHWPDRVAYIGDIDITGYRRPISYLREIVFGLRKAPYIAVDDLTHYGEKPGRTPWMWRDNIASWTWPGYEGKPAIVNVLSAAEEVELFLNGRSLGRKQAGEAAGFTAEFELAYEPGELKAVSYANGKETGSHTLVSAGEPVSLGVHVDRDTIKAGGADLAYVTVSLNDDSGNLNMNAVKTVTVAVEGAGTLQGYGSAQPQSEGSYQDTVCETYNGSVMAVIRAGKETGEIKITFKAEGCEAVTRVVKTV